MTYKRTDLALEMVQMHKEKTAEKGEIDGITISEQSENGIKVTRVKVLDENGSALISKPIGNYVTIEADTLDYTNKADYENMCDVLKSELSHIIDVDLSKPVLVVGLGNRNITADALGPKVVENMLVTRHLFEQMPDLAQSFAASVCAIAPGVLGITGIETMEIVKGVVKRVNPGLVIAVDALASRKIQRVNTTIQISDTGINPGSGVGNNRKALCRETLGVDVIAIGVPTVVDGITVALDVIETCGVKLEDEKKDDILRSEKGMMVTPKEVDLMIKRASKLIALSVNLALQPAMTAEDIMSIIG